MKTTSARRGVGVAAMAAAALACAVPGAAVMAQQYVPSIIQRYPNGNRQQTIESQIDRSGDLVQTVAWYRDDGKTEISEEETVFAAPDHRLVRRKTTRSWRDGRRAGAIPTEENQESYDLGPNGRIQGGRSQRMARESDGRPIRMDQYDWVADPRQSSGGRWSPTMVTAYTYGADGSRTMTTDSYDATPSHVVERWGADGTHTRDCEKGRHGASLTETHARWDRRGTLLDESLVERDATGRQIGGIRRAWTPFSPVPMFDRWQSGANAWQRVDGADRVAYDRGTPLEQLYGAPPAGDIRPRPEDGHRIDLATSDDPAQRKLEVPPAGDPASDRRARVEGDLIAAEQAQDDATYERRTSPGTLQALQTQAEADRRMRDAKGAFDSLPADEKPRVRADLARWWDGVVKDQREKSRRHKGLADDSRQQAKRLREEAREAQGLERELKTSQARDAEDQADAWDQTAAREDRRAAEAERHAQSYAR